MDGKCVILLCAVLDSFARIDLRLDVLTQQCTEELTTQGFKRFVNLLDVAEKNPVY